MSNRSQMVSEASQLMKVIHDHDLELAVYLLRRFAAAPPDTGNAEADNNFSDFSQNTTEDFGGGESDFNNDFNGGNNSSGFSDETDFGAGNDTADFSGGGGDFTGGDDLTGGGDFTGGDGFDDVVDDAGDFGGGDDGFSTGGDDFNSGFSDFNVPAPSGKAMIGKSGGKGAPRF